mgnify:CR=1 FL=1
MFGIAGDFYENLKFIRHEYEEAQWDADSGKDPAVMEAELRAHFEAGERERRPYPIVFAEGFRYVLQNGRLAINPHTIFPEKLCNGVVYQPHARAGVLEKLSTEHFNKYLDGALPGVRKMRILSAITGLAIPDLDVWHAVFEWESIVGLGFPGIRARALAEKQKKEEAGGLTAEQAIFYESVEIALDGVFAYLERLAAAAEAAGLHEVAAVYTALTKRAPQTLYEVITAQHIAMTAGELGRERIRSYGHLDKLWTPYYVADLAAGRLDAEKTRELLRYFLIKIAAENRYANQPMCFGAYCKEGTPALELILMFLDEYQKLGIQNPKLQVRCPKDMPPVLLRRLMEMTRSGSSSVILFNDEVVIRGYEKLGVPRKTAEQYLPMGCNETVLPGLEEMHICSAWINLVKGVEYTMTGGEDLLRQIYLFGRSKLPATWDAFLETYFDYLRRFAEFTLDNINKQAPHAYRANPAPFLSSVMTSCVESGRDVFDGGLPMHDESVKIFALGTAVDSLLAVKKFVYEKRMVTLPEFAQILRDNWRGGETLRAMIRLDPIKWGNGETEADELAANIYSFMAQQIVGRPTANGGVFRMGGDSVNMAERYGMNTGASADGRGACAPLSKNIRPSNGCEHRGISGLLKSFAAIDWTDAVDGAPCDFMLHPTAVEGEIGLDMMCSIINIFFAGGGHCIQGNVIDIDTLLAAKKDPENYKDLQVRVCGWNEYFVNMNPTVQSDFIKRASGGRYA